jgi:hypothetical protein
MNWSDWHPLEKQSSHSGPAVYELRMVRGKNNPVSIPRFLGGDKHGLLPLEELLAWNLGGSSSSAG